MSIINLIKSEQKVVRIGNLEIGGKPGELPTTLCGCMFYMKHKTTRLNHFASPGDLIVFPVYAYFSLQCIQFMTLNIRV